MFRKPLAEFVATFTLVFCGCGAIVVNETSRGQVTHVGVSLVFGLVVLAMISAVGEISGAHMNPAVTFALWLGKKFPARDVPAYVGGQLLGALAACGILKILFPLNDRLGATIPSGTSGQSFVLEFFLSFFLMLAVAMLAEKGTGEKTPVAFVVGGIVALEALFGGPISGASMNPARSFGPAVFSGHIESLWIYIFAPLLGMAVAVAVGRTLKPVENPA